MSVGTIAPDMGKKKKAPKTDRHLHPRLVVHLPQAYHDLLEDLAAETRRSKKAEVAMALERHFREAGLDVSRLPVRASKAKKPPDVPP